MSRCFVFLSIDAAALAPLLLMLCAFHKLAVSIMTAGVVDIILSAGASLVGHV